MKLPKLRKTKKGIDATPAMDAGPIPGLGVEADETIERLISMMYDEDNIGMKTDYRSPAAIANMQIVADYFRIAIGKKDDQGDYQSPVADMIDHWIEHYSINRVSEERRSREELVHIVAEIRKQKTSMMEQLAQPP